MSFCLSKGYRDCFETKLAHLGGNFRGLLEQRCAPVIPLHPVNKRDFTFFPVRSILTTLTHPSLIDVTGFVYHFNFTLYNPYNEEIFSNDVWHPGVAKCYTTRRRHLTVTLAKDENRCGEESPWELLQHSAGK